MMHISDSFLDDIEFNRITQFLIESAVGETVKKFFQQQLFYNNPDALKKELDLVACFKNYVQLEESPSLMAYRDLSAILDLLTIEDYALDVPDILDIGALVQNSLTFIKSFEQLEQDYELLRHISPDPVAAVQILKQLNARFDQDGTVKDNASPELKVIRQTLRAKLASIDKLFNKEMESLKKANYLADPPESIRGGRRVLCVKSENKRKINGVIHDISASHQTIFIEPAALVEAHNNCFELRNDEQKEIYRIRQEISRFLAQFVFDIQAYERFINILDRLSAKVKLAIKLNGVVPSITTDPVFDIIEGKHPILTLNFGSTEKVIPFTLQLFGKNRILMISGPNAGGKTVTLKAVGLIQCMVQHGLMIPVDPGSTFGIFSSFYADIGDHQSVDQGLSTYSSHLKKMSEITKNGDRQTLVLIDELGSGTDPKLGGAIAQAVVEELLKKQVFAVISTHYSNLKTFAHRTKGVVNASMQFDQDNLIPTYQLRVGKPGSSYAFQVADMSGLSKNIIHRAKKLSGQQQQNFEALLAKLEREKEALESELQEVQSQQKKLQRLINSYEKMQFDLNVKKKKLKLEEKIKERNAVAQANKDLERLIRELRETQNLEQAKQTAKRLRVEKKDLDRQIQESKDIILNKRQEDFTIREGDYVKTKMGMIGQVLSIRKKKARIQVGGMEVDVAIKELEPAQTPIETNPNRSISTSLKMATKVYRKIDIVGLNKQEALKRLEKFFDEAIVANLRQLEIVHGKGNGVLRRTVREKLDEYQIAYEVRHPEPEAGGEGLSIVTFI